MHVTDPPELPAQPGFTVRAPGFAVVSAPDPTGTHHLTLVGELDRASRPTFDQAVDRALRDGPPTLVLELAELEFLAVAGGHAFAATRERCHLGGGQLILLNPTRAARRLLDLFGLTELVIDR